MGITSAEFDTSIMSESPSVFDNVAVGNSYEVISIDVDVKMKDQIAEVSVTQKLMNSTDRDLEIEIFFPLPNGGIVQDFMMMVDGVEVPGALLEKDKAKGFIMKHLDEDVSALALRFSTKVDFSLRNCLHLIQL